MEIQFSIFGNQEDPLGNPLPKLRMTRGGLWKKEAQRYMAWAGFVQAQFYKRLDTLALDSVRSIQPMVERGIIDYIGPKPLTIPPGYKAQMDLKIWWGSGVHGDPENVFGSIADALFKNDKYLAGSFDFEEKKGRGIVHAWIKFIPL